MHSLVCWLWLHVAPSWQPMTWMLYTGSDFNFCLSPHFRLATNRTQASLKAMIAACCSQGPGCRLSPSLAKHTGMPEGRLCKLSQTDETNFRALNPAHKTEHARSACAQANSKTGQQFLQDTLFGVRKRELQTCMRSTCVLWKSDAKQRQHQLRLESFWIYLRSDFACRRNLDSAQKRLPCPRRGGKSAAPGALPAGNHRSMLPPWP